MKVAAIVIEEWKLPIFKDGLDNEGYDYSEHIGPTLGCITLRVQTSSILALQPVVKKMNAAAAKAKRH